MLLRRSCCFFYAHQQCLRTLQVATAQEVRYPRRTAKMLSCCTTTQRKVCLLLKSPDLVPERDRPSLTSEPPQLEKLFEAQWRAPSAMQPLRLLVLCTGYQSFPRHLSHWYTGTTHIEASLICSCCLSIARSANFENATRRLRATLLGMQRHYTSGNYCTSNVLREGFAPDFGSFCAHDLVVPAIGSSLKEKY